MRDHKIIELLFATLNSALFGAPVKEEAYRYLSETEWQSLFKLATRQGVLAIAYDVILQLPNNCHPPRNINLAWALSVEAIEDRYKKQLLGAKYLAEVWNSAGIKTVVMKGIALGQYYPVPEHRECGDFDCYLLNDKYEEGNLIAEQHGAKVNREWYKHSQIYFREMMAENHLFLVTTRKGKSTKYLNKILINCLNKELQYFPNSKILLPTTEFNALFVTYHSFAHFMSEGITLRHLCDWACFIKAEENNIDWGNFYNLCKRFQFDRFVDVSNAIIATYFGIEFQNKAIICSSPYTDKVIQDILFEDSKIFSGGKGKWRKRLKLITNIYNYSWKFRDIGYSSSTKYLLKIVVGFLLKREQH